MVGLLAFTAASCDSDRDNNPTINDVPTQNAFVLNTPAYSTANVDLATSDSLRFTWSQPDYGFPAAVEYTMQFSIDNVWTTSVDDSIADETGATHPTYASVGNPTSSVVGYVGGADLAKALEQLTHWADGEVPTSLGVYARCQAVYANDTVFSNIVSLKVLPYYVELKNADPEIWYLTGACIGDGGWGTEVGVGVLPMTPLAGESYDAATGRGVIGWTGYLTTDGFKLKKVANDWNVQIGQGDAYGQFKVDDGGSANITVPENGVYTVTLDTKQYAADEAAGNATTTALKITKYTGTAKVNSQMLIAGDFNSWATDVQMKAVNTYAGAENHDWYYDLDATSGDTTAKFLTDSTWGTNWGSDTFPYGWGVQNGSNIPVTAGNYRIFFNDITGTYYFVAK